MIEHVAHFLPAQGPITAFVHHNTLHAFQSDRFKEALKKGQAVFGAEPFWPESRFRKELEGGRILNSDIEYALQEVLGETADENIDGFGKRIQIRNAILHHAIYTASQSELEWFIAESNALKAFRQDAPTAIVDRMVSDTQHWLMRDLLNQSDSTSSDHNCLADASRLKEFVDRAKRGKPHQWQPVAWKKFTLTFLWEVCRHGVSLVPLRQSQYEKRRRLRDLLLCETDLDIDEWVNSLLIKFSSAFLDQGFAHWSLPARDRGFWKCFLDVYTNSLGPAETWRRGLDAELQQLKSNQTTSIEVIAQFLNRSGVTEDEAEEWMMRQLLVLRGFAGMVHQVETRGDRVFQSIPPGTLIDFLAVRLLLSDHAERYVLKEILGWNVDPVDARKRLEALHPTPPQLTDDQRAFLVFQLAQVLGWNPQVLVKLSVDEWSALLGELESFDEFERRHVFQLAFEHHYANQTLHALSVHNAGKRIGESEKTSKTRPKFQIVCCIDDREESFRRHLEEVEPRCETFGMAGFFAVVMYFKGVAEAHFLPLCPVIIKPQHFVREEAVYSLQKQENLNRKRREQLGRFSRGFHLGSRTLTGGWLGTTLLGALATIPLVARVLAPRATAKLRERFSGLIRPPAATELQLERVADPPGSENGHVGFSVNEMANCVQRTLEDIGLTKDFSRLVVIVGHGSSSLNNPHESAYNCGACAGARGGPNARAFAQMANDMRVRDLLRERGIAIPTDTCFVGSYHNTCDDGFSLFDLDRVPSSHRDLLEETISIIEVARARNAHERCRRFQSADLTMTADSALRHVEGRSQDLSQARPEYNHATNALCFVGRREWSRGLFLDRRAFLTSYDPRIDDENNKILTRILQAAVPVCAGISLEYYFSTVDNEGYGCGNKLPHNITSMLGVMTGAESDLRPGLSAQMVEIHEPMRLMFVIESTPKALTSIIESNPGIKEFVAGDWVQLVCFEPEKNLLHRYADGKFKLLNTDSESLPIARYSADWYRGWRDHLAFAQVTAGYETIPTSSNT
ncbi:MAG: DUF2309 domain-containing protein [Pirellulaceae bacterium]